MKIISKPIWLSALMIGSMFYFTTYQTKAWAQFRGQDSQQFFDRGNEIIEQQIEQIQKENRETEKNGQTLELKTELEPNNSVEIQNQEIPDSEVLEDNMSGMKTDDCKKELVK